MHPFHSSKNTKNAQLIFTTHDTTLLDSDLLRRDQIGFLEKTADQTTHLYPLLGLQHGHSFDVVPEIASLARSRSSFARGESEQAYYDTIRPATEVTENRGRNPKRPGRLGTHLGRGIG